MSDFVATILFQIKIQLGLTVIDNIKRSFIDELYHLNYKSNSLVHRLPFYWYRPLKIFSRLLALPVILFFMV